MQVDDIARARHEIGLCLAHQVDHLHGSLHGHQLAHMQVAHMRNPNAVERRWPSRHPQLLLTKADSGPKMPSHQHPAEKTIRQGGHHRMPQRGARETPLCIGTRCGASVREQVTKRLGA
jgi:hypothetical protein